MPAINTTLPRPSYKFMGQTVTIPYNWSTGDTLTENDAKFINRSLASVVGNLLGSRIRTEVEALQKAEAAKPEADRRRDPKDPTKFYTFTSEDLPAGWAQAKADEVFLAYTPGVTNTRTGSGASAHDPVQSIADNIAWEKIKPLLAKKNIAINKVKADKRRELIEGYLAKFPDIMEQAKTIFAAATTPTDSADDDDGLDFSGIDDGPSTDAGSTEPGADTTVAGDATDVGVDDGTDNLTGDEGTDSVAGDAGVPDSEPSSTAETDGATAADADASPANPGTVGTTNEGTGQGTPGKGAAKGGTKDSGVALPDEAKPANPPAAFS